jgi:hypothetical protein
MFSPLLQGPNPKSVIASPADCHCGFTNSKVIFSSLLANDLTYPEDTFTYTEYN